MSLTVTFLGTGGSVPTSDRGLPAVLIHRDGEHFLFDCGEGVQRQMIIGKTGFHKKMKVFITHMHGDHVLGLPGLMQTMALLDRQKRLDVYGPLGIQIFLEAMRESLAFGLTFPVEIHEIEKPGIICDEEEYEVEAVRSDHVIQSFAYAFVEKPRPGRFHPEKAKALNVTEGPLWSKLQHGDNVRLPSGRIVRPEQVADSARAGRKIIYTGDTRPFKSLVTLALNADMLIHDGTLDDELAERAELDGHSTPSQAASTAKKAKVKQLVLTHISARYSDASILMKQAKKTFRKTLMAKDFMKIDVPSPRI